MKTKHFRFDRTPVNLTLEGAHLFRVTGSTTDDRETKVVAADDEWAARSRFMLVTAMKPRGKEVTFAVVQLPDPKRVSVRPEQIQALVDRSADAYSADAYASWPACAAAILRRGYTIEQGEAILRSKITRWAADDNKRHGRATAQDLLRRMDRCPNDTIAVLHESGLHELSAEEWTEYHSVLDRTSRRLCSRDTLIERAVAAVSTELAEPTWTKYRMPDLVKISSVDEIRRVVATSLNIVIANGTTIKYADSYVDAVARDAIMAIGRNQPRKRAKRIKHEEIAS